jgi:rhodanese-related sulfurtransferase
VAQQLRDLGFDAAALEGGFDAWRTAHPVEPVAVAA